MRVGILAHGPARHPTGVPRASLELLHALLELPDAPEFVVLGDEDLGAVDARHLDLARVRLPARLATVNRGVQHSLGLRISHLTCVAGWLPTVARQHRLDVIHDFTGLAPFPRRLPSTLAVATLHDLVSHRRKSTNDVLDDLIQRRWLRWALRHVDAVVTVSDTVSADVRRIFGLPETPVVAVPHGVDHQLRLADGPAPECELARPYLLAVGVTSERKNMQALVRAASPHWRAGRLPPLVMVGPEGPVLRRVLDAARQLGVQDFVSSAGYVPDRALGAYYEAAVALVYPSVDEGFGLPVLEAMAHGTPVLTAAGGATAEVAGDAALLVDPHSEESLAEGLLQIAHDSRLRAELVRRGALRAAEFSWRRSARTLIGLYTELLEAPCG
ncbi:MAG: glycosyltransferase family 4 protein [Actinomycetota bacterium]|nr:glycosyltransferase family 4 protein [Actinomycetota bacterium]